jgi:hypothetical protein
MLDVTCQFSLFNLILFDVPNVDMAKYKTVGAANIMFVDIIHRPVFI